MTDLTPSSPDDARDELVSAVLDDEADDATRARVASDPELTARLEQMRAVRDLVAAPVAPLDEVTGRRLREAALDEAHGSPAVVAATASRDTHRRTPPAARWLVSAAAVVLLVLVAIPVLGSLPTNDDDGDESADSASEATSMIESADAGESFDESGGRAGDDAATTDMNSIIGGSLGVFDTDEALAAAAIDAVQSPPVVDDESTSEESDGANGAQPEALTSRDEVCRGSSDDTVAVFVAQVAGEARVVHVVALDRGERGARILEAETCRVVFTSR